MKRTLVIGDVHGNYDRLLALLVQEGIVDPETEKRIPCEDECIEVVQLGDLGDFRDNPTGDRFCFEKGLEWFDVMLWGNHERAAIDSLHRFEGQVPMTHGMQDAFSAMRASGKLRLAWTAHDFLLTHAGLHKQFLTPTAGRNQLDWKAGDSVSSLATELTLIEQRGDRHPVIDNISVHRGGGDTVGGVIWRHAAEKLAPIPQVFGHSRGKRVRTYFSKGAKSYCIDVGRRDNGRLAAIWLPEERVVEVNLPARSHGEVALPYAPGR